LLKQLEQEVISELEKYISKHVFLKQTAQTMQTMKQILDYIAKNADLFKVLLSENGDSSFQRDIMLLAQQKTISDLRNDLSIDARISEYLQCFVITGSLSIVQKWLQDGMVESTQKMAELISKLLYQGLSDFYS
jgi:tRNA(Phe) wybutosine-synthesizing methylase Tyw3